VFKVTLVAPEGWVVKSNMPLVKAKPASGGLVAHAFAPTPLMSTYLAAFAVGQTVEESTTCKLMNGDTKITHFAVPSG
jgi:aminopeptidase N